MNKKVITAAVGLALLIVAAITATPSLSSAQEGALQTNRSANITQVGGTNVGSSLPVSITNTAGSTDPCQNPAALKKSALVTLTSTTAQELVTVSGSTAIYVCSFTATIQGSATTVGTLQFEYGTKTTNGCDTGTTTLTDTFQGNITASVPTPISAGFGGTLFSTVAAKELCAVATGTTISVRGFVTYVQQ